MSQHIFQSSGELQNSREGRLRTLASFSVRERLARYGSSALSGVEHLRLLVGRDSAVDTLLGHFGSLKELERASFQELRQFLTRREAEAVIAGLSMWSVVDTEEALSCPLDKAEAVYRANLEMRCFRQEVVRVVLLDVQNYWITSVDVCKGTLDESPAHPRDIFRPVIVHAAAGFVLVQ
jgi:DNA repair protein RadC